MASVHRMSPPQLQRLIRSRSGDPAAVLVTRHCRLRMRQRHISLSVLLDVLRLGTLRRRPEPDAVHGSVICRMEHFVAGRNLAAAVALSDDEPGVIVVTVIDLGD
jgi:hypothetical protein